MTSTRLTKKIKKAQQGFTLIELLVVIGILAVLLSIVLIAINPARQFAQANNTQRRSNINAILNAIHEYAADSKGNLPNGIPTCTPVAPATTCPADPSFNMTSTAGGVNICGDLVTRYLAAMPVDPKTGSYTDCTTYDTKYEVYKSGVDNRITVFAPGFESPETQLITVTR